MSWILFWVAYVWLLVVLAVVFGYASAEVDMQAKRERERDV